MSAEERKLIRCGDHSLAPWAITCVHICEGTADDALAIPQPEGSEVEFDWLCRKCYEDQAAGAGGDDLRVVCIHCLRELLKRCRRLVSPGGEG